MRLFIRRNGIQYKTSSGRRICIIDIHAKEKGRGLSQKLFFAMQGGTTEAIWFATPKADRNDDSWDRLFYLGNWICYFIYSRKRLTFRMIMSFIAKLNPIANNLVP